MSVATELGFLPEIMAATSAGLHGFLWHSLTPNACLLAYDICMYVYICTHSLIPKACLLAYDTYMYVCM